MTDEQKSIVIGVEMREGERRFALEFDKKIRRCTQACLSSSLKQGITKGDEVLYTVNPGDQFSYLKKTGKTFKLDELPKSAAELLKMKPIIDADAELAKLQQRAKEAGLGACVEAAGQAREIVQKTANESSRINHEVHRSEIIHWQALLNTATEIVIFGGDETEERSIDGVVVDETTEQAVKRVAENLHTFIMEKVGEGK